MTPEQQLALLDEQIKVAEKHVEQLYDYRRRLINQYDLNKGKYQNINVTRPLF
ncbi:hypothetical protein [Gilliamella sp. wkB308]|uniref:hypothetical protein n=1 Tax=Gilliamella sp. wkB308 TaxID=3120263 RepID=UPI0015CF58B9|nr:hypothetical protein [Gilliamella apicola]